MNLLQSFSVTLDGRVVSVEEVRRGKACDCCCTACGEILIARQGDVRAWHFAHASGGDCAGAAESALHLAAKQLIVEEGQILVPALEASASHRLEDGRIGEASLERRPENWRLDGARSEVPVGALRIDVAATHDGVPIFIEVAVTHLVDEAKQEALATLRTACFEIVLDPYLHEAWTWDDLRQDVLLCSGNRRWLYHPELSALKHKVQCKAVAKAYAKPLQVNGEPETHRLRWSGVPIWLVDRGWCLTLWWSFNDNVNPALKAVARSFGGRYNPKYRNWVFPVGVKAALLEQLFGIGAVSQR
jgi:hypothetical protein